MRSSSSTFAMARGCHRRSSASSLRSKPGGTIRPSTPGSGAVARSYGGHTKPALRRAARLCDGWIGAGYTEEVLYGQDQQISPLSSYFELMDRLLPNFLGVITPQKIRGTRVLLQ